MYLFVVQELYNHIHCDAMQISAFHTNKIIFLINTKPSGTAALNVSCKYNNMLTVD